MEKYKVKIPFNKPFVVGKELYNIAQAVFECHLSGGGPFTKKCHMWLENNLKCQKALLTHSCTAALEMAALLCDIKPGDEVIMPSYTFVSTANAFVLRGGIPVFVDIRPDTLNLDESKISQAITSKTKAIVPVHYAGVPCDMKKIMEIANQHNFWVIEDAAHALLSKYNDKFLGTIGHFGCLSFHETKNIISGEGGALLINDERFIERAEIIREKGTNRSKFFRGEIGKYTWVDIGSSYLPSELIGAFLYAQFEEAEKIGLKRHRIFRKYYKLLKKLEEDGLISLPDEENLDTCNGHIFHVITNTGDERNRLIKYLKKNGIVSVFHYVPLHSSPAGQKFGRIGSDMAITDDISSRLLRLPMYYKMNVNDVEMVVKIINEFYGI